MTKNNTNKTPSNDEEFLDSENSNVPYNYENGSLESIQTDSTITSTNLENEQEEIPAKNEDNILDNDKINNSDNENINSTEEINIPLTLSNTSLKLSTTTSSKNITSTQKYLVILSTPTKYVIDLKERGGASYTHTTYTLSQNYISGVTEIEEPIPEEGN